MIDVAPALQRVLERLRREQDPEGAFCGELSSGMNSFFYATSLALAGEPPTNPAVQDICDCVEAWSTPEGGVPLYPGEPPDAMRTNEARLLLGWARPRSPAISRAGAWLAASNEAVGSFPLLNVSRWALDPSSRASVLADRGPAAGLRRFSMFAWPRIYEHFEIRKFFRQPYRPPSRLTRMLFGPMTEWMFWPVEGRAHELPGVVPPHIILSILPAHAALRRLAGDKSPELDRMNAVTLRYMADHRYADGSVLYLNFLPSYLLCAEAFGLEEERALLRSGLEKLSYRKGGWLRGSAVSINVLDTAMTLAGLLRAGVPKADPLVARAAEFLRSAQSVAGMWSWGYERAMNGSRVGDTDDTGASCAALGALGDPRDRRAIAAGVANVVRLQSRAGAINTFDIAPASNTPSVSTTSRGIRAMLAGGMAPDHPAVRHACGWLASQQEADGKWVDHWMARWIYGTVMALEGLLAAKHVAPSSPEAHRAVSWLLRQQNVDGGWGENYHGTRSASSPEHTAMAVYGLAIGSRPDSRPIAAIEAGVRWLVDRQLPDGGWSPTYIGAYSLGEGYASTAIATYWALHAFAEYRRVAPAQGDRVARLRRSADDAAPP